MFRQFGEIKFAVRHSSAKEGGAWSSCPGAAIGSAGESSARAGGAVLTAAIAATRERVAHFFGGEEPVAVFVGVFQRFFTLSRRLFRQLREIDFSVLSTSRGKEVAAGATRVTTVFVLAESHGRCGHNESEGNSECLFHFCVSLFIRTRVRFQRCEYIATPVYATSF